jgi:glycosyltransferase involved in cell wall biosynthesis
LLLLAWTFPPEATGGTFRPLALARYADQCGWDVTVICGPIPAEATAAGLALLESAGDHPIVLRVAASDLKPSYRVFFRVDGGFLDALSTFELGRSALHMRAPDVVMASGPPFHNFVAGAFLARFFHAKLVLEYRDEWTMSPFGFVHLGNSDAFWERRCLKRADQVIFTTRSQLEHAQSSFPVLNSKPCTVIENGWESEEQALEDAAVPDLTTCGRDAILLSYVGNLSDHTRPDGFLSMLAQLLAEDPDLHARVKFCMVGRVSGTVEGVLRAFPFPNNLLRVGLQPRPVARALMRRSTAVVVLNPEKLARYLPGKVYDYIASNRPLLVYGEGGEVSALVRKLNVGIIVREGDREALRRAILEFWRCPTDARTAAPSVESCESLAASLCRYVLGRAVSEHTCL